MAMMRELRSLNAVQRNTFFACFLGWTLDAFDYFLLTLCLTAIARDFHTSIETVAEATFWTLAMRPAGAFLFGLMAERYGRRPTLMLNIVSFSTFGLASAFAPTIGSFMVLRALFGLAMGGEWGVGAALAFETLPAEGRGFFSGLLQEGYVVGSFLAAALYWLLFPHLHGTGMLSAWRVMFMIGSLPALLALYLRFKVEESPVWLAARAKGQSLRASLRWSELVRYLPAFLFLIALMTAFNSFSHGTQDMYPTFLQHDHHIVPAHVGLLVMIGNLGALAGGICWGWASERMGRKGAIIAAALLALPMVPLWAWSHSVVLLGVGGFLMQFMVQGAWGIVPAHLNELSPGPVRAIFPGLTYQLGNLIASRNNVFQVMLANRFSGGMLKMVMSVTVLVVALAVAGITALGREAAGVEFSGEP
ncbi:MFS transporter [Edaphobacter acidisoli]|uniref:MFS transporter n=2 Tax=Edaphobacter acidisoli TaxID=2040573 RepID=A0A916RZJ7_9BACT|nr:MFS transporter [Edaphobacter acidisoli]